MHHVIESKMCANLNSFSPAITFTANYLKTVFSHLLLTLTEAEVVAIVTAQPCLELYLSL